jgi:hypothetical protein
MRTLCFLYLNLQRKDHLVTSYTVMNLQFYKRQTKFLNIWAAFSISRRNALHALSFFNGEQ